jgi:hypothetical protein
MESAETAVVVTVCSRGCFFTTGAGVGIAIPGVEAEMALAKSCRILDALSSF